MFPIFEPAIMNAQLIAVERDRGAVLRTLDASLPAQPPQ